MKIDKKFLLAWEEYKEWNYRTMITRGLGVLINRPPTIEGFLDYLSLPKPKKKKIKDK